jgi:DNA-binding XRE family transcriptional regulator
MGERNLEKKRRRQDFTQEEFAAGTGIDVTYLRGTEAGRRNPNLLVMIGLATLFARVQSYPGKNLTPKSSHPSAIWKNKRWPSLTPSPLWARDYRMPETLWTSFLAIAEAMTEDIRRKHGPASDHYIFDERHLGTLRQAGTMEACAYPILPATSERLAAR